MRDFLTVIVDQWPEVVAGRWRLVLAVSTNANAITHLDDLAKLAQSVLSGEEVEKRLIQPGRTNDGVRARYDHLKSLVEQAAVELTSASGLTPTELTWRLLSALTVRRLRLEGTDRTDRTTAVNALLRVLHQGTPATADALFSRIEELVGGWAPQGAVLNQLVVRRSLGDFHLARSPRYDRAWAAIDQLGKRLRASIRPTLEAGTEILELERVEERTRLTEAMRIVGGSAGALVVTGDPDIGKSALSLRVTEALLEDGAAVTSLSLRDLPHSASELEMQLGGDSLEEVLAAGEVRPLRLLLVDGTESVLEGKMSMLLTLTAAAQKAGLGVIAVTRADGRRKVSEVLARSSELAEIGTIPVEHTLGPLVKSERDQLAAAFPTLSRLQGDVRTSWLLERPGLVDVLLRTGKDLDPADFLCEADVFYAVWRSLVRNDEDRSAGNASPDDREFAVLSAAKQSLGLPRGHIPGPAFAELRSDGILQIPHNPAMASGHEFTTDLFRDFALCRLFLEEGWQTLAMAGAPRWSIRATRLGCQAALVKQDASCVWEALTTQFSRIAADHGERWLEVPYEALLTLSDAESAIRALWTTLTAEGGASLVTLLRLAEARYVDSTIGDAFALAPLVKVTFCDRPTIRHAPYLGYRTVRDAIQEIVLAWLRGMVTFRTQSDSLRQAVRDTILADDPSLHDEFVIEALATLGPDLDDRAEARLREVARDCPAYLAPAVESLFVSTSMSLVRPQLLLDLSEAYYIELPDPHDRWGGHPLDDGIRDSKQRLGFGFGAPAAAWYYGPFFRLLNAYPVEAISFINRMLDHAARFRVRELPTYRTNDNCAGEIEGVTLDLPCTGKRLFVGDSHVWAWYRGTSVGPYACMSALLALERFADDLLERLGVPAQRIVELLLTDCHNLAVLGLVVGFLTRHPNDAGALMDPFLASPAIWHLETLRAIGDYGFRVRDPDADKLTGSERRSFQFHQTVGEMVINARLAGDEERLAQLESLAESLVASARRDLAGTGGSSAEDLAVIENWAAEFCITNYRLSSSGDSVFVQFERPERLQRILAPGDVELQTANSLSRLQLTYGRHNENPDEWPIASLVDDLATARQIDASSDTSTVILWPENALASVAAAAVRAHALGSATIENSDLVWAIESILWAAENPQIDGMSYEDTLFPMGADRAAAGALPLLLLPPFAALNLDQE
ncbi:MAG: ATP-binding protein, partial [Propionibacteriaceae bacterium]|nr:ATP-binding protein [Propionibacteriaceae bacterium]